MEVIVNNAMDNKSNIWYLENIDAQRNWINHQKGTPAINFRKEN